jgi:hypothetical protein
MYMRGFGVRTMPVYLCTIHAYRSWSEGHPRGFVQRGDGLKKTNQRLARWRADHASHEPARFAPQTQELILDVTVQIAQECKTRLHVITVTRTHVHMLISFRSPACTCGASARHCRKNCPARDLAGKFIVRDKRKVGQAIAKQQATAGRPWLSRGWDMTPVKDRPHFDHLVQRYLPKHVSAENGIMRVFD